MRAYDHRAVRRRGHDCKGQRAVLEILTGEDDGGGAVLLQGNLSIVGDWNLIHKHGKFIGCLRKRVISSKSQPIIAGLTEGDRRASGRNIVESRLANAFLLAPECAEIGPVG